MKSFKSYRLTACLLLPLMFVIPACAGDSFTGGGKNNSKKPSEQYSIVYNVLKDLKYDKTGEVISEEQTKTDKAVQVVVLIQGDDVFNNLREHVSDLPSVSCKIDDVEERELNCRVGVENTKLVVTPYVEAPGGDVLSVTVSDTTFGKGVG